MDIGYIFFLVFPKNFFLLTINFINNKINLDLLYTIISFVQDTAETHTSFFLGQVNIFKSLFKRKYDGRSWGVREGLFFCSSVHQATPFPI